MKIPEPKWYQFRRKIINWQNKQINDRSGTIDRAEEHSISILQKRYGYSREQAASELHKYYSKAWLG